MVNAQEANWSRGGYPRKIYSVCILVPITIRTSYLDRIAHGEIDISRVGGQLGGVQRV